MPTTRNLSVGFAGGAIGTIPLLLLLYVLHSAGRGPEVTLALIYKDVTWGGLWGLLLALPWLGSRWWLRGIILGVAAALVLLAFFIPAGAALDAVRVIMILVLHLVWGLAAAYWYRIAA